MARKHYFDIALVKPPVDIKRLAYKMLTIVGERTSMIYLGSFLLTAALTHVMAHTAVAATMFPLLLAIYALYDEGDGSTPFGKGLFIGMAFFMMIMTNFIMNAAAIAISLPVALVIAPYLGVAREVILFSSLVVAGMSFLFLVGAAPNAIAYNSKQFTTGEFFLYGIPASIMLMLVTWLAVVIIWPLMGMDVVSSR